MYSGASKKWSPFHPSTAPVAANKHMSTSVAAFWTARRSVFNTQDPGPRGDNDEPPETSGTPDVKKNPTLESLGLPSTWIISLFLLVYVGVEVTIGGWIFTFLVDLRYTTTAIAGAVIFTY
jgi:fucose permease